jgi:hypothetical protein
MTTSSPTVSNFALQLAKLTDAQDDLRSLVLDVLKEMLKISQVQAEANLKFMQLVEGQTALLQAWTSVGPGSTRTVSESDEYQEWRDSIDRTMRDSG